MALNNATLDRLIWIFVYSGMLAAALGFFLLPRDAVLGWSIVAVGGLDALAGVVLIWLRSRHSD